jgi:hypothetical protein
MEIIKRKTNFEINLLNFDSAMFCNYSSFQTSSDVFPCVSSIFFGAHVTHKNINNNLIYFSVI